MNDLTRDVERMILQFFQGKDNHELKKIKCGRDVDDKLDEETIEEIKDQIWYLLKTQHIRWYYLADSIKDMVRCDPEGYDAEDEEDEDEEDAETDED